MYLATVQLSHRWSYLTPVSVRLVTPARILRGVLLFRRLAEHPPQEGTVRNRRVPSRTVNNSTPIATRAAVLRRTRSASGSEGKAINREAVAKSRMPKIESGSGCPPSVSFPENSRDTASNKHETRQARNNKALVNRPDLGALFIRRFGLSVSCRLDGFSKFMDVAEITNRNRIHDTTSIQTNQQESCPNHPHPRRRRSHQAHQRSSWYSLLMS